MILTPDRAARYWGFFGVFLAESGLDPGAAARLNPVKLGRNIWGTVMADWVETFRGAILAVEYDSESHMNSQLYVSRFDQATWFLLHAIGVTPAGMRARDQRIAIIRQNYQYLRELRGGDLVVVRSGFVAVSDKYLRFIHRMFDHQSGQLIATCDCTAAEASLKTGKTEALPVTERAAAEARLVTDNVAKAVGLN